MSILVSISFECRPYYKGLNFDSALLQDAICLTMLYMMLETERYGSCKCVTIFNLQLLSLESKVPILTYNVLGKIPAIFLHIILLYLLPAGGRLQPVLVSKSRSWL